MYIVLELFRDKKHYFYFYANGFIYNQQNNIKTKLIKS